ncbi:MULTISPECIES: threonine ammonia-lyase [Thermomonospora]|uniref:L-threonine dehydratase catabolic TdcB n=1 Tax=Thermomonospora curvata (strain ATCC 19995 / DSM 43183 / JCM 3096 / KCTC 9072 / NBRC 15933 / NCIMB 10081 / Henssen B9) TaxID=471852 RepID=D1A7Q4_THECD|nr:MULTISPECIES: threonine ammonia-lyase [Thermomonospora]ACY96643.1 threonine dehydratase [Thermomonospora curvata DSM 43183]PKK15443.1 MAG: threonine ammonia-lyase [Thermomonospora sp. CIF 1]
MALVGARRVEEARELLRGVVTETPLLHSRALSQIVGGPVLLKCENLQRTGSFKARGAYVRIARLTEAERSRGVVAASAGNHAQGVALAASLLGCKATVFMPQGAPLPKIAATRSYGAEVLFPGPGVDECLSAARRHADAHGAVLIHPFDHPDVIAGQGTIALEILRARPDVRTIVTAVGGGGLISGLAVAAKAARPDIKIIGVQAKRAAAFPPSLAAGRPVRIRPGPTMADGIAVGSPGELTFALVRELVDAVVTVTEESISQALLLCLERAKQVVEPAGAAGVAAILEHSYAFEPPVVAVLSGGNIDPLLLSKVLRHGLAGAGRYLVVRVRLPDRPGALVTLLSELAELGANVLDVMHERVAARLHVEEAEVLLHLETRGPDHCQEVLGRLRAKGHALKLG